MSVHESANGGMLPLSGQECRVSWIGLVVALHPLHEPHRNTLTATCTSCKTSLPEDAIHSAVFDFVPAQSVIVRTGRSLPSPVSAFVNSARNRCSKREAQVRRPPSEYTNLAEITIELLFGVRKTPARASGARPNPQSVLRAWGGRDRRILEASW